MSRTSCKRYIDPHGHIYSHKKYILCFNIGNVNERKLKLINNHKLILKYIDFFKVFKYSANNTFNIQLNEVTIFNYLFLL